MLKRLLTPLAGLALLASAGSAFAQTAAPTLNSGDTAWMLTSTLLVILMSIPGLALFYGGLGRAKNMLSVLTQVFVIYALISVLWGIYGYTLAFGGSGLIVGGATTDNLLRLNLTPNVVYRITALAYGRKPGTMAVLQQTYARQIRKD